MAITLPGDSLLSWERWPTDAVGETPGWAGIEQLC